MSPSKSDRTLQINRERILPVAIVWGLTVVIIAMIALSQLEAKAGPNPRAEGGQTQPRVNPSAAARTPSSAQASPRPTQSSTQAPVASTVSLASLAGRPGEPDLSVAKRSCSALAGLVPIVTGQTGIQDPSDPVLVQALRDVATVGRATGGGALSAKVRTSAAALADGAMRAIATRDPNVQGPALQEANTGLTTLKTTCRRVG